MGISQLMEGKFGDDRARERYIGRYKISARLFDMYDAYELKMSFTLWTWRTRRYAPYLCAKSPGPGPGTGRSARWRWRYHVVFLWCAISALAAVHTCMLCRVVRIHTWRNRYIEICHARINHWLKGYLKKENASFPPLSLFYLTSTHLKDTLQLQDSSPDVVSILLKLCCIYSWLIDLFFQEFSILHVRKSERARN